MSEKTKKPTAKQDIIAGGTTGVISRFFVAPFDVIKIKMQVQYGHYGQRVYSSIGSVLKDIYRKEGLTYFWNGNMAAEYMYCLYSSVQFLVVHHIRDLHLSKSESLNIFYGGCVSGVCSTLVSYPFDLARTRMAAQQAHKTYNNAFKLLYSVVKESHLRGLYTGILPTLLQISPYTAMNFTFYDFFVRHSYFHNSFMNSINGFFSGSLAKMVVYPLDTIKKQMQTRTMFEHSSTKSTFQLLTLMYKKGGVQAFYSGLLPSLVKSGVSTSIYFGLYDYISRLIIDNNLFK